MPCAPQTAMGDQQTYDSHASASVNQVAVAAIGCMSPLVQGHLCHDRCTRMCVNAPLLDSIHLPFFMTCTWPLLIASSQCDQEAAVQTRSAEQQKCPHLGAQLIDSMAAESELNNAAARMLSGSDSSAAGCSGTPSAHNSHLPTCNHAAQHWSRSTCGLPWLVRAQPAMAMGSGQECWL